MTTRLEEYEHFKRDPACTPSTGTLKADGAIAELQAELDEERGELAELKAQFDAHIAYSDELKADARRWRERHGKAVELLEQAEAELDDKPRKTYLSAAAVGRRLGLNKSTVTRWIEAGKLPAFRTPGGHWRVRRLDVEAMEREQTAVRQTPRQSPH